MGERRLTMPAIAIAVVLCLAPLPGRAVLETTDVPMTVCKVGNESLTYDATAQLFRFSSDVYCGAANQASINLALAGYRTIAGTKAFWPFPTNVICSTCASAQISGTATKAQVPDETYTLKSTAKVKVNSTAPEKTAVHGNCYRVVGTTVILLTNGCALA